MIGIAADPRNAGADDIVVCDTIGQAVPTQVADSSHGVRERTPQRRIVFHGHDTWGLGVANTLAAIDAGATLVDGSLGGLGGCPFAPGASGNTSTEDLLFATRPDWFTPIYAGVDGGDHRQAPRGNGRTEPLPIRPGRAVQIKGVRLGYRNSKRLIGRAVTGDSAFLVTYPIPEPGLSSLRAAGRVHVPAAHRTPEELGEACSSGEFAVVVAQLSDRFDADLLAQAKVRGISNYAVGYDNIDIAAATRNNIVVGNTPGVLTEATADLAMLLILATARRAIEADQFTRSGQFTGWRPELLLGQDVSGATLGLAGFGRIARATALRAAAFGMTIIFCSHPPAGQLVDQAELAALPYPARQVSWNELVESSDFLSLHVPLATTTDTSSTRPCSRR